MGLANGDVARVVDNSLITAEGVRFGKSGRAAGHKGERLVVAETAEEIVLGGERVVQAGVEFGFVQSAHGFVDVVVAGTGAAGVGVRRGIDVHHGLANVVDQAGGNLVTGSTLGLASIGLGS
jgi:hypothetical protein